MVNFLPNPCRGLRARSGDAVAKTGPPNVLQVALQTALPTMPERARMLPIEND